MGYGSAALVLAVLVYDTVCVAGLWVLGLITLYGWWGGWAFVTLPALFANLVDVARSTAAVVDALVKEVE